jgi:plasmid rolling circle replication initiator protein Rep
MSERVLDEWKIALKKKIEELEACQNSKALNSCLKCQELLNCDIRDSYIKAVYESMSKGKGGGFEF